MRFIFKAYIMYKYRRDFAVLQFRFPVIFTLSAVGMFVYWISRLLFVFVVMDWYIYSIYQIIFFFVFLF